MWPAHLDCVSDFLICGPGVWWIDHGDHLEFLDGLKEDNSKQEGPPLHHFRSYNLKVEDYLEECWKKCTDEKIPIPIENVRVRNSKGDLVSMQTAHPQNTHSEPLSPLHPQRVNQPMINMINKLLINLPMQRNLMTPLSMIKLHVHIHMQRSVFMNSVNIWRTFTTQLPMDNQHAHMQRIPITPC